MRRGSLILLSMSGVLACSGKRLHAGDDVGGLAGSMAPSGAAGSAGGATAGAGGAAIAGAGGAPTAGAGGTPIAGAGGAPIAGAGGDGGASGGTGGASTATAPRFLLLDVLDPSGTLQPARDYMVQLSGVSDDGSVLVGSSMYADTTMTFGVGVNFYWTAATGVVKVDQPSASRPNVGYWPSVTPDGSSLFGPSDHGFYRWSRQAYEFFDVSLATMSNYVNLAISRDGTTAWAGASGANQSVQSFRWRRSDGLVDTTTLPGWPADGVYATYLQPTTCRACGFLDDRSPLSDDGKVVAGYHSSPSSATPFYRGFIWSEPGTFVELVPLAGTSACNVGALSRDGTSAFGGCFTNGADVTMQIPTAFRWTAATGMVALGPGDYSDTTRDGRVAMGGRWTRNALYRWTAEGGAVQLQPPSDVISPAHYTMSMTMGSLSADGGSVYGRLVRADFQPGFEEETPEEPFRWSVDGGFVPLGVLPGHDIATISAASPDGSVQVGTSRTRFGNPNYLPAAAVLWDCRGIRNIDAELTAAGINTGLNEGSNGPMRVWSGASSIMIVGYGQVRGRFDVDTRTWIAWLPRRC